MTMRSSAVHQIELHCQMIYTRLIFDLVQEEFGGVNLKIGSLTIAMFSVRVADALIENDFFEKYSYV